MRHFNLKSEAYLLAFSIVIATIFTMCLGVPYKFLVSGIALLYLASFNRKSLYVMTALHALITLAFPVTLNYGLPNKAHYFNMLNSNPNESMEFLEQVSTLDIIGIMLVTLILLAGYLWLGRHYFKNKLAQYFEASDLKEAAVPTPKTKRLEIIKVSVLCLVLLFIGLRCYPTKILADTVKYTKLSLGEIDKYNKLINTPSDFVVTKNTKKIKNVVVVIGESVETDYLSVFGYPHPTTPILAKTPGLFFKNNISAASYTFPSMMRSLTVTPDATTYQLNNNIVALANKAGYSTYYFATGKDDDKQFLNDYFAGLAKYNFLSLPNTTNKKQRSVNRNQDDMQLLKFFDLAVNAQEEYRMIFLHMFGHHPNVCHRLKSYPNHFAKLKHTIANNAPDELNCYLSVTHKLDAFLGHIYTTLQAQNESFYLFYLSEHGLYFDLDSALKTFIHHGEKYKSNYRAPLMIMSSEITEHQVNQDFISGNDFLSIFEYYLGLDSNLVPAKPIEALKYQDPNDVPVVANGIEKRYGPMKDFKVYY